MKGGGISKILNLILVSNGFYFLVNFAWNAARGEARQYLREALSFQRLRDWLLFNQSPFCEPLWYLNALLYVMAIVLLLDHVGCRKILYWFAPILIVADLVLGKYSIFIFGQYFPNILTRNWLFVGLPNVATGMMIREYKVIERTCTYRKQLMIICGSLSAGLIIEHLLLKCSSIQAERDNYIFVELLAVATFVAFAQSKENASILLNKAAELGRKCSTGVYVSHPFFIMLLSAFFELVGLERVFTILKPIVVFMVSVVATGSMMCLKRIRL